MGLLDGGVITPRSRSSGKVLRRELVATAIDAAPLGAPRDDDRQATPSAGEHA